MAGSRQARGVRGRDLSRSLLGRLLALGVWLLAALLPAGCRSTPLVAPEPVRLSIAGSTTLAPMLRDLAGEYQRLHPNVLVDIQASDTGAGLRALAAGETGLAAVSWQPAQAALLPGASGVPVARDAIALIVNPANTLPGLTLLQAKAVYQGEVLDWRALGGPALDTVVVSREDGSGTREAFEKLVMGSDRVTLNALVMPSSQAIVDYVARHPGAIGYVSAGLTDDRVRVLPIEDVTPGRPNIQTGAYHLTRVLYLYRAPGGGPTAQAFLDFAISPAGQAIVARHFLPVRN